MRLLNRECREIAALAALASTFVIGVAALPSRAEEADAGTAGSTSVTESPAPTPATTPAPPSPSPWAGTVELYGFAPLRTTGTTTVRGLTAELDLDLEQVLRPLTKAAYIRGSVEHNRIGFLADLSYISLQGEAAKVIGGFDRERSFGLLDRRNAQFSAGERNFNASIDNIQGIYDLALRYRFGERESAVAKAGSFTLIPYAGVRVVDVQLGLGFERQTPDRSLTLSGPRGSKTLQTASRTVTRRGDFGGTVAQPLLGAQAMLFLTPRLRLFGRGDIGGLGSDNNGRSWNAQLGVGYAVGNSTQLNLSWRYLHLENDNGETPANAYDLNQNGIEAGVKFFF